MARAWFARALFSIVILIPAKSTLAADDPASSIVDRLDELINVNQFDQAYALATENLSGLEGDPRFDLLYGIAAVETDNPNPAIYALQGALSSGQPQLQVRARLELARAYYMTNNLSASEKLFLEALADNPPPNVRDNILAYLVLIDAQHRTQASTFDWTVGVDVGHDDNINASTSNGLVDTPLTGTIELDPQALKSSDDYSQMSAGVVYKKFITQDKSLNADLNLSRRDNFSSDDFDLNVLQAEVSFLDRDQANLFKYSLRTQSVQLDATNYLVMAGASADWQHSSDNGWFQSATASFSTIRYDNDSSNNNDLRDVNQKLVTVGLTRIWDSFTNSTDIYYADESAVKSAGKHNGRQFYGAANTTLWQLSSIQTPYLRLGFQELEHKARHPVFFQDTRSESTISGSVGWLWQLNRRLMINSELSYAHVDSNIALYDYTRFKIKAGFQYQFLSGR